MPGPVYLHWDGSYETYHAFFAAGLPNRYSALCWRPVMHAQTWASYSALYRFGRLIFFAHLWCKLDNINISGLEFGLGDLIVGSDEERALTKQWKLVFCKQLHFFAVDILRKICDEDCRIKTAFQQKCGGIVTHLFGSEGRAGGR